MSLLRRRTFTSPALYLHITPSNITILSMGIVPSNLVKIVDDDMCNGTFQAVVLQDVILLTLQNNKVLENTV